MDEELSIIRVVSLFLWPVLITNFLASLSFLLGLAQHDDTEHIMLPAPGMDSLSLFLSLSPLSLFLSSLSSTSKHEHSPKVDHGFFEWSLCGDVCTVMSLDLKISVICNSVETFK